MNMAIEAIMYSQALGLDPLQVDVFYCRVAMFDVPELNWWHNKYKRSSDEYEKRMQELQSTEQPVPVQLERSHIADTVLYMRDLKPKPDNI